MKLKKAIFNIFLFIIVFAGSTGAVLYSKYANYKKELKNNPQTEILVDANMSQEQTVLNGLIQKITTAESLGGTITISSTDKKALVNCDVNYKMMQDGNIKLTASINGKYNGSNLELDVVYQNNTAYINIAGTKVSIKTDEIFELLQNLLNNQTNSDLSGVLNTDVLLQAVNGMQTIKQQNGCELIKLTVPNLCTLQVLAMADGTPISATINNLKVANQNFNITAKFSNKADLGYNTPLSSYTPLSITQDTVNIATNVVNIAKNFEGIALKGNITLKNLPNIGVTLFIDKNYNIKAVLDAKSLTATIYYINNEFYLDFMETQIKLNATELFDFLNNTLKIPVSSNTKFGIINNTIVFNNNTLTFNVSEHNILSAHLKADGMSIDLNALNFVGVVETPNVTYNPVTITELKNLYNRIYNLATANSYTFQIDAKVNGASIFAQCYLQTLPGFEGVEKFAVSGTLNNNKIGVYYLNNVYYVNINDIKARFNSECATELLNFISSKTSASFIDGFDIAEFIKTYAINLDYNGGESFAINTNVGSAKLVVRSTRTDITLNNLKIAGVTINGSATAYIGEKVNLFNGIGALSGYKNLSNTSTLVNAVSNTLNKTGRTMSGSISFHFKDFNIWDVNIAVTPIKTNGQIGLQIRLSNLPTTSLVTIYNPLIHTNSACTLTITTNQLKVVHTVYNKWSNSTITDVNKTYALNNLSINILKEVLGLDNNLFKLINKQNTGSASSIPVGELFKGLQIANNQLSYNLRTGLTVMGIDTFNVKMKYSNNLITSLWAGIAINNFTMVLNLK